MDSDPKKSQRGNAGTVRYSADHKIDHIVVSKEFDPAKLRPDDPARYSALISALRRYEIDNQSIDPCNMPRYSVTSSRRQSRVVFRLPVHGFDRLVKQNRLYVPPAPLTVDRLVATVDWIPSPKTRKLLTKVVADQVAHLRDLERNGRYKAAKWQLYASWGLIAWYGVLHTVSSVFKAVRGKIAG